MSVPRIIPVLLLRDGGLVKTVKFSNAKYIGDPINAVRIFNEKEADELIFLDIDATDQGKSPDFSFISDIAAECFMPFSYGGGVRTLEHIQTLIKLGVEKVILNTILFENANLVREACAQFGQQSVVAAIDVKKNVWGRYLVYSHGGQKNTKRELLDWAREVESMGVGEIMVTSMDNEGTGTGYDLKLYEQLKGKLNVPVIAHGGAGNISDFKKVLETDGATAVAAGSFFTFHGKHRAVLITYPKYSEIKSLFTTG